MEPSLRWLGLTTYSVGSQVGGSALTIQVCQPFSRTNNLSPPPTIYPTICWFGLERGLGTLSTTSQQTKYLLIYQGEQGECCRGINSIC